MSELIGIAPTAGICPMTKAVLDVSDYKNKLVCNQCQHAEPDATGRVLRYGRGVARVRCRYHDRDIPTPRETLTEGAAEPEPLPEVRVMDPVRDFINAQAAIGIAWINCPVCGLRRADSCPMGDDRLAPCRRG